MALLPRSCLLLPSPLGDSCCPSSAPLPSLCPNPCGEHASHLSPCGGIRAFLPVQQGSRQRKHILATFAQRILVCGRQGRVALLLTEAGCQLCREMVRAMALLWGCLALKPTVSHESKRPTVAVPHWLGSSCAQVCTDVFSWQVQPAQAWPVQHISQQFHHVFSPSWPGTWQAQAAPTEQHEPILNSATRCTWRQVSMRPRSIQLTASRFAVST